MKVIELIKASEKTAFSFEILPPLKGTGIEKVYETIYCRRFVPSVRGNCGNDAADVAVSASGR